MKVNPVLAEQTLFALGYKVWKSDSGKTLNARRGQNHITIALDSRRVDAHRDMPGSPGYVHRALRDPFTHRILEEFREAYQRALRGGLRNGEKDRAG